MQTLSTSDVWKRFAHSAALTTAVCLPVVHVLLRLTGVPPTYPPLLPQQVVAGTFGGAILVTVGNWALSPPAVPLTQARK
jgi:hypothetical protein